MPRKIVFDNAQLDELQSMMAQGIRQTDIAKHFSVTDDTIRRICKENGFQVNMPHKCKCILCGEEFYSNIKSASICKKDHTRTCVVCGKEFKVDRTNVRETCSRRCTNLLKYGEEYPGRSDKVKSKRLATMRERYGVDNISQLPETQEKVKQTSLAKYGVTSYRKTQECEDRIRKTNLKRYGYECAFGDSAFRQHTDSINLARYGTIHPMQNSKIREKQRATMNERYGVSNCMQLDWVQEKLKQTMLDRYGVPCGVFLADNTDTHVISNINRQFADILNHNGIETSFEKRIHNRSYDIVIEDQKIVIEIDPTISHNTYINIFGNGKPISPKYHRDKSKLANDSGYTCIHIFDWDSWECILPLLLPKESIYARQCMLTKIDERTANEFTRQFHLQGSCKGQEENYALVYNGEVVQVMTFGKPRYNRNYDWELLRLCTRHGMRIVGGPSRLFKHFLIDYPGNSVISYCDLAKFTGNVYTSIGMKLRNVNEPSRIWSKETVKITDNLLRQRGYDQLFGTNYGKGTSNEDLMLKDGWLPVYDCGQAVYVYCQ